MYQGKSHLRKDHVDNVVYRLQHQCDFAAKALTRFHDLSNVCNSVGGREKGAVEPSASLADELRECIRDIRLSNGAFDVLKYPEAAEYDLVVM